MLDSIIPHNYQNEKQIKSRMKNFFNEFKISELLRKSNFFKLSGASCFVVFKLIFMLVFTGKNLYQLLESKSAKIPCKKDAVYNFLNSVHYNWRKLLLLLSSKVIKSKIYPLTSEDRTNVLIIDDSLYRRARSKTVELLAKVHDHSTNKLVKGFRMLTLGWSDGNSFIPVAFSLLSSSKQKHRINEVKTEIDKRTNGYKRRKEAVRKATETMFNLIEAACKYGLPTDYVLFDSWFAYPKIIKKVLAYDLNVVCRLKAMYRVFYWYNGKKLNLKQLYNAVKKDKGRIAASVIVGLDSKKDTKAKVVFIRDDNNKDRWIALLSTDLEMKDEKVIQTYGKRWDIEVFFKMNKSYLKLAKEFQGQSYDMMFAHTTIVFIRYIMLSLKVRQNEDSRTFGGVFMLFCDELSDIKFMEALLLIINSLKKTLNDCLKLSEQKINELLDYFFGLLPSYIKQPLGILNSES